MTLFAPYHPSMRLGQGFNSFTQTILLDDAVLFSSSSPTPHTPLSRSSSTATFFLDTNEIYGAPVPKTSPKNESTDESTGQVVTYSSSFVQNLSDLTDSLHLSPSSVLRNPTTLGKFVDSDKFKQADLNLHISVRVTTALSTTTPPFSSHSYVSFQPLPNLDSSSSHIDGGEPFVGLYGDTYISSFETGGSFDAVVSIRVLDKAKRAEVVKEARMVLSAYCCHPTKRTETTDINIAKAKVDENSEITIRVSYSGGPPLNPGPEGWDLDSVISTAARFAAGVLERPVVTYAVLRKYDTLRSFIEFCPANYNLPQYDLAMAYATELMETYMEYKLLLCQLSADIWEVRDGMKDLIDPGEEGGTEMSGGWGGLATLEGLDNARHSIRAEMGKIAVEMKAMEKHPRKATDENRGQRYTSPAVMKKRIPKLVSGPIGQAPKVSAATLLGPQTGQSALFISLAPHTLTTNEQSKLDHYALTRQNIGTNLRMTAPLGNPNAGESFCALDFLEPDFVISSITAKVSDGALSLLSVVYVNGLVLSHGAERADSPSTTLVLDQLAMPECVIAATIEIGERVDEPGVSRVTALHLYTNRGRALYACASTTRVIGSGRASLDDVDYMFLSSASFNAPLTGGYLTGFWGRSEDSGLGLFRLGLIWGNVYVPPPPPPSMIPSIALTVTMPPPQTGTMKSGEFWPAGSAPGLAVNQVIQLYPAMEAAPRMLFGLGMVDMDSCAAPVVSTNISVGTITPEGFVGFINTAAGKPLYAAHMTWMALPDTNWALPFETGVVTCGELPRNGATRVSVQFSKEYVNNMTVSCWFTAVKIGESATSRKVRVIPRMVDSKGFTLCFETWGGTLVDSVSAGWVVHETNTTGVRSGSVVRKIGQARMGNSKFDAGAFARDPLVFIALNEIDIGNTANVRARCSVKAATREGVQWDLESWGDTVMNQLGATWVAVE